MSSSNLFKGEKSLNYLFAGKGITPSFDPEASDLIRNTLHMDQLVGTLLKERYGNSGRTEPSVAEKWTVSGNGLVWDFFLKSGLRCEDGTPIDAHGFVESFNRILKIYSSRKDLAAFNRLTGWKKFLAGSQEIEGIRALGPDHLQFSFDKKPDGFAEFLAMPFYGFYCPGNFLNGKWKDPQNIISSGSYVVEYLKGSELSLRKRSGFSLISADAPDKIRIAEVPVEKIADLSKKHTIIYFHQSGEEKHVSGFQFFQGAPIFLSALVLSPYVKNVFDRIENRNIFREKLFELIERNPPTFPQVTREGGFYVNSEKWIGPKKNNEKVDLVRTGIHPIKVLRFSYASMTPEKKYVEDLVTNALRELQWPYELVDPQLGESTFITRRNTNREYDLRLAAVDIGGSAENWVINMMFCSQLAISFPDPSGRVCKLVSDYEGKMGEYDEREYLKKFDAVVGEDNSVIPIFHTRSFWLHSEDLDASETLFPTMVVPRLDKLKFL